MQRKKAELVIQIIRRTLVEIPCFYLGISLLEYWVFGNVQAWTLQSTIQFLHPYWFAILLFSILYGVLGGFVSAVFASILVVGLSPLQFSYNPLEWGNISTLPLLFIVIGLLIGLVSNQQTTKLKESASQVKKLAKQLSELHTITNQLTRSNLNLEKKIVFRLETFQSVYEIAEKLNKLNLDQLYNAIPQLVAKYFHAEQCSFYLVETGASLVLKSTHGWSQINSHPSEYESESALYRKICTFEDTSILSSEILQSLEIDAAFAVALITREKQLLGMIKIEQIDFLKISQDNLNFLSSLSRWFIQSIINGLRYAQREKESTFDPRTGLVREDTFWFLVKKIVASAVRHKYDAVLLNLSLRFPKDKGTIEKNALGHSIGTILQKACRIEDEVGIADLNRDYSFMLMMAHTNKQQAQVVINRITESISEQLAEKYPYLENSDFLAWEILSLEDGTFFLSETVQQMIFDPILAE